MRRSPGPSVTVSVADALIGLHALHFSATHAGAQQSRFVSGSSQHGRLLLLREPVGTFLPRFRGAQLHGGAGPGTADRGVHTRRRHARTCTLRLLSSVDTCMARQRPVRATYALHLPVPATATPDRHRRRRSSSCASSLALLLLVDKHACACAPSARAGAGPPDLTGGRHGASHAHTDGDR